MPAADGTQNPYASPAKIAPEGDRSILRASFVVGKEERHVVAASLNPWTGGESYFVDVRRIVRTHKWWGTRQFNAGVREPHKVVIRVTALAWVRVYVEGELFEDDLFPAARRLVQAAVGFPLLLWLLTCVVRFFP